MGISGYGYGDTSVYSGSSSGLTGAGALVIFLLLFYIVVLAYAVIAYIVGAKAFSKIAARRNVAKSWLAWIPYANTWLLGAIADDYCLKAEGKNTNYRRNLIIVMAVTMCASFPLSVVSVMMEYVNDISVIFFFLLIELAVLAIALAGAVYQYIVYYKVFKSCAPEKATLYLILSIIFSVAMPFLLSSISDRDDGFSEGCVIDLE